MSLNALSVGFRLRLELRQCMLCLSEWSWELVVARNALRHTGRSMESKSYEWQNEDHWMEAAKPYLLVIAAISFIVMVGALCTSP